MSLLISASLYILVASLSMIIYRLTFCVFQLLKCFFCSVAVLFFWLNCANIDSVILQLSLNCHCLNGSTERFLYATNEFDMVKQLSLWFWGNIINWQQPPLSKSDSTKMRVKTICTTSIQQIQYVQCQYNTYYVIIQLQFQKC